MERMIKNNGVLPIRVRLAYGCGEIGKNFIIFINNMFMLYFYTDVIKLDPGVAAMIIFVARIWDFLNDPLMGMLCDKTRSKEGKVRFWLKYFSVPGGLILFLSYFVPELQGNMKVVWVFATYILQATVSTILNVPMNSMALRLTESAQERVVLGQYKNIMTIFPRLIADSCTLPLVAFLGKGSEQRGFAVCMALYGGFYALSFLICYWGTKGYDLPYQEEKKKTADGERMSQDIRFWELLLGVVRNKYCLIVMTANILYLVFSAVQSSSMVHYLKYNIGNTDVLAYKSMLSTIVGIATTLFLIPWVKKISNARAAVVSCAVVVFAEIVRLFLHDSTTAYYLLGAAVEGVGLSIFSLIITQCMYDSVEYGRRRLGINLQAMVMALAAFGQQVGSAVGSAVAGALLDAAGYVSGTENVTDSFRKLFFAENVIAPMVTFIMIGLIFFYVAKMEDKLKKDRSIESI